MNDRACVYCGSLFTPTKKHPQKQYCSRACVMRHNAERQRLPPMVCAECGATFTGLSRTRRFCSRRCSGIAGTRDRTYMPVADRFWASIQRTDTCWLWTAGTSGAGYGTISVGHQKADYAHRVSWQLHYGPIPDGIHVCHNCDTPACVRPDHLFLGTPKDNTQDMIAKDRHSRGERRQRHKLNDDIVRSIRRSRATNASLARQYGVNAAVISRIRARKSWKHVS